MKTKRNALVYVTAGFALPILWTLGVTDAGARPPRSANATVNRTGPAGNTASRQTNVSTTGAGGFNSSSTYTGRAGNTATRQQSGSYDAASKTWNRSATTTGPAGNQSTLHSSVQATSNGYARNATRTGPNGKSATENRTVTVGTPATPPSN